MPEALQFADAKGTSAASRAERSWWWAVVGCTLLALVPRLYRVGYWGLWVDEGEVLHFASLPALQIISTCTTGCHPPLFYVLAHYWGLLASSVWWYRLLPALLGVALVPTVYFLFRPLVGGTPAFFASLLVALYSTDKTDPVPRTVPDLLAQPDS